MKNIIIFGGGPSGIMMYNKLRYALDREEWKITVIDSEKNTLLPTCSFVIHFGVYNKDDVIKPKMDF